MKIVLLILLGLCLGSFINALVWRVHEQAKSKKSRHNPKLSISRGRSMCVHCGHELAVKDLLPVLSWLSLRGKCRYCKKPIDDSPLTEIITAMLFVASYVYWPFSWELATQIQFGLWLVILTLFIALAIYDKRWMLLPNRLVFPLVAVTTVFASVTVVTGEQPLVVLSSIIMSVLIAAGLFYGLYIASKGAWIGGGDAKLGVALGLVLGSPMLSIAMLFIASCLGSIWALPSILRTGTAKTKIPFGPFLIAGTIITFLYGESFIHWYREAFLYGL